MNESQRSLVDQEKGKDLGIPVQVVALVDASGNIVHFTSQFTELFGIKKSEIPKMTLQNSKKKTLQEVRRIYLQFRDKKKLDPTVLYVRKSNHSQVPLVAWPFVKNETFGGFALVPNIITFELQDADMGSWAADSRVFQNVFDSLPIPAFLWEQTQQDTLLRLFNSAAVEFTQGKIKEKVGETVEILFPDMPEIRDALFECITTGIPIRGEVPCVAPELGISGIFVFSFSLLGSNLVVMTITDITRYVRVQQRLESQRNELNRFAHEMSHDIRGLLQNIILYAELLEKDNQLAARGIRDIIIRIDELLARSIELAESGMVIGMQRWHQLGNIVDTAAQSILPPNVTLHRGSLPSVNCDKEKTIQIFVNLFKNSVEHGNATKIEVYYEDKEDYISVYVRNNGKPIDSKIRKKLFVKRASTKSEGGRGLLIVKRLVEAHGWAIKLLPKKITTFRIMIPKEMVQDFKSKKTDENITDGTT